MGTFLKDIQYAVRMLAKNPGFAVIAILTLALGIGANTAIFSVVNGVMLNPLPYPQPNRLVSLYRKAFKFDQASVPYLSFLDWQKGNRTYEAMGAYRGDDYNLTGMGEAERVPIGQVSADFFPVLGENPIAGRFFRADEDRPGAAPVIVLGEGFWKRKFGGAPDVLGRTLMLNGTGYTVIGIVRDNFKIFTEGAVYVPIGQWNDPTFRDRAVGMGMDVVARLRPGVTLAQARADMDSVAHQQAIDYPDSNGGMGITATPLLDDLIGKRKPILFILLGAVGFVLLIACVNVANLLLARSTGRARELAIRLALGATRGRIIRQLLTESILVALAGGALGLLLAAWGTNVMLKFLPAALPRMDEIGVDGRVLAFTLATSLLAGILFGLAPALKISRSDVQTSLKEGGRSVVRTRNRAQGVLVVAEIAMALVLLVGAGLMIRSVEQLWRVNPGFDPHNAVEFSVALAPDKTTDAAKIRATYRQLLDGLTATPGVEAVSLFAGSLPLKGGDSDFPFWLEGQPKPATRNEMSLALWYSVSPDYLRVMKIPLLRGRFITEEDNERAAPVMVIDESFAKEVFGETNPIGHHLNIDMLNVSPEIVGVVGHVKHWGLDESNRPMHAEMYVPFMQTDDKFLPLFVNGASVIVRTKGAPASALGAIREEVSKLDSRQVMYDTMTMDEIVARSVRAQRFSMILLGAFAALALLLAAIGIYGVISYLVGQRVNEIGVRMALGAQQKDILRLVVGDGARLAFIGAAAGVLVALGVTRLMANQLYAVSATDPLTFAGVAALLVGVALFACYIPARRAMRVDPMVALRHE
ncbi:MAG TPA: ABC transporter permease [Terriglobales bacterium]|jgi:predicted permease|nr:ABC transporter permease [Terriglobales bacterium]